MTSSEIALFAIEGFDGVLMRPGEPEYDDARRVFNGMIDRYPALIARCASADDVATVVLMARAGAAGANGAGRRPRGQRCGGC